ncbi:MAG: tetratricopeptide repeat protein [Candidatus Krumholzibacteriia bacterium]
MRKIWLALGVAGVLIMVGLATDRADGPEKRDRAAAEKRFQRGLEHLFAFQYPQAEQELGTAMELDPEHAMAATALAELARRLGRDDAYEPALQRADSLATRTDDRRLRVLTQLWLSNHPLSRFRDDQDSLLALAQETDSLHLLVLQTRAGGADRDGDTAEVERLWRRLLEAHPNHAGAYNHLGYIALYRGRYDEAVSLMRKYAFIAPDLANPHDSLGEVLMIIGRFDEAEDEFRRALAKQPDFFYSILNLGRLFLARGQLDEGVALLEELRRQTEGTAIARQVDQVLIETYFVNRLMSDLERACRQYVSNYPDDDSSAYYRAMILVARRPQEAQAVMDSAVTAWREQPKYQESSYRVRVETARERFAGVAAELRGDWAEAARKWQSILEREAHLPEHQRRYARERLATAFLELGRPAESLEQLQPVLEVNASLPYPLLAAARAHLALDQPEQARRYLPALEKAVARADPDFPLRQAAEELRQSLGEAPPP